MQENIYGGDLTGGWGGAAATFLRNSIARVLGASEEKWKIGKYLTHQP